MHRSKSAVAEDAAADAAEARRFGQYHAERAAAQVQVIASSMDRRRFGAAPANCDGDYEVLEQ